MKILFTNTNMFIYDVIRSWSWWLGWLYVKVPQRHGTLFIISITGWHGQDSIIYRRHKVLGAALHNIHSPWSKALLEEQIVTVMRLPLWNYDNQLLLDITWLLNSSYYSYCVLDNPINTWCLQVCPLKYIRLAFILQVSIHIVNSWRKVHNIY